MTSGPEDRDAGAPPQGARVRAFLPVPTERSRTAIVVSALLHLLLIVLLVRVTASVVQPTHSPIGDAFQIAIGGGGGGGKGGVTITAPPVTRAPEPVVPPPPPVAPTVVPPAVIPPVETPAPKTEPAPAPAPAAPGAGTGGGSGGGTGTGKGPGTGSGVGPGSGSGTGGGNGTGGCPTAPEGRQMILPAPDPPKPDRGKEIDVTLLVDSTGKVTSVSLKPQITDRNYARKFEELMRGYSFLPARDCNGRPIAATTVVTVTVN